MSSTTASRYVANCSILFTDRPVLDRPAAAAAAGFTEIEFWWPFDSADPSAGDVDAFVAAVSSAGVAVTGLNYYAGDMPAGERGIIADAARVEEFRSGVRAAHALGQRLGCTVFNALYGLRGPADPEQQEQVALDNLRYAAEQAAAVGATVLLEPLSGAPTYPLRTVADVRAVLANVAAGGGPANVALLADWFHLAANGEELLTVIESAADITRHVQIADFPGRHEPGTGELDFPALLEALAATGYSGRVALEYVPTEGTEQGLSNLSALG